MLLENPSTYLAFAENDMAEIDFLAEIARRTGCGLLLDVNNVFVSATNQRTDPRSYIDAFPLHEVGEIHLGGHDEDADEHRRAAADRQPRAPVVDPVWALYRHTITVGGPRPTADRMGQRRARLADLARRGGPRGADPGQRGRMTVAQSEFRAGAAGPVAAGARRV